MKKQPKIRKVILTETQVKKLIDTLANQSLNEQRKKSNTYRLMSSI
jgi:hypothetical protein